MLAKYQFDGIEYYEQPICSGDSKDEIILTAAVNGISIDLTKSAISDIVIHHDPVFKKTNDIRYIFDKSRQELEGIESYAEVNLKIDDEF